MRVLMLVHANLIPPQFATRQAAMRSAWRTEFDIFHSLRRLGHQIEIIGLDDSLDPLETAIDQFKPRIIFNLLEEFSSQSQMEPSVVAYMELRGIKYTGCKSQGLVIAQNKAWAKAVAKGAELQTPNHSVIKYKSLNMADASIGYPAIVKYLDEESSMGLTTQSVVRTPSQLRKRVEKMWSILPSDILVEDFIEGREFYVSVLGTRSPVVLPPRELCFGRLPDRYPRIATARMKWSGKFRRRYSIYTRTIPRSQTRLIQDLSANAVRCYSALGLSGYARLDFRQNPNGRLFFLEANPNPQICRSEDFADSARAQGMTYDGLVSEILKIGLQS